MTRTAPPGEGLDEVEAAALLVREGPNELPRPRRRSVVRRVGAQLVDPLVLVLVGVAVVTVAIGDHTDAAVVLLVIVGNTSVGWCRRSGPTAPSRPWTASGPRGHGSGAVE